MKRFFKKDNYYILYSIVFIIVFMIAFSQFFLNGKSFISVGDGIKQHYNSLVYFGQYVRGILKTLFFQGKLEIPTWDFSLAMGADVITTLHYYAIGDPLNLLYVVVPSAYSEYLYDFLIFLRLYLAGITFSVYSRKWNKNRMATLCGALVYVFCSYTFLISTVHIFFANPMIYLPLLLLGIEMIYERKSPVLFIVMVFLSAISNFYFFYVLSLLIFTYAVVRFFFIFKEHRIRNMFLQLRNFIGYYCIALLSACTIFLPVVMMTLNTGRRQTKPSIDLFYGFDYYSKIFSAFLSSVSPGNEALMGWGCIPLLLLFLLFLQKRGVYSQLKIGVGICFVFISFPFFGSLFNAFSYVTNRWILGFSFLIGILVVFMIERFETISVKEWYITLSLSIIYIIITLWADKTLYKNSQFCLAFLLFCICTIGLLRLLRTPKKVLYPCFMILICINIFINSYYLYAPNHQAYVNLFMPKNTAFVSITEVGGSSVPNDNEIFYRYGESNSEQNVALNAAAINKKYSTSGYYSLVDSSITQYFQEILSSTGMSDTVFAGFDDRAIPQTLANTKYYVIANNRKRYLPYGYRQKVSTYKAETDGGVMAGQTFSAYANDYFLPFGYTYDSYIDSKDWNQLNFLEKQEAMLQTCYIADSEYVNVPENTTIRFDNVNLPFEVECGEGISYERGRITVSNPNAIMNIHFQGLPDSETYINISNLKYDTLKGSDDVYPEDCFIYASMNKRNKFLRCYTEKFNWYNGINDYAVNMGYKKKAPSNIKLTFRRCGIYTFDDFSFYSFPMNNFESNINKLKENVLQNTELITNGINGEIDLDKAKILCLTIPYGKGWKGYVDGKEVPLLQTNTIYTGISLEPGHHEICLRYQTPYLATGITLSCFGIVIFIALLAYRKIKKL